MNFNTIDSVAVIQGSCTTIFQSSGNNSGLDNTYKIAMICIALFNVVFAVYIFFLKDQKEEIINERNRKIGLLKSLILDHNMKHLYDFFDRIDKETQVFLKDGLSISEKKTSNDILIDFGKVLRQKFIDTLIAIDKGLYDDIILATDNLLDSLTESIFNEGINLSHPPMFEQKITNTVTESKTCIIKTLFSYKGE